MSQISSSVGRKQQRDLVEFVRTATQKTCCFGSPKADNVIQVNQGFLQLASKQRIAPRIDDTLSQKMSTGAWFDPEKPGKIGSMCKHGNVNVLTLDKGTSKLAQEPVTHTCLVDITLFEGEIPTLAAYKAPEI